MGAFGRNLDTGFSRIFTELLAVLTDLCALNTEPSSVTSSHSNALAKIDLQPSAPPLAYTQSITSTTPITAPLDSHTGRVRNLLSCIICKASSTVVSGDTASGLGVITEDTLVSSKGNSFAMARLIMSLKPKMPSNFPFFTTKAAFRASAIIAPTSWREAVGGTIVDGLPAKMLRSVGELCPPKA